eukprot:m.29676 g.29676  ORF g.29676 m.29676 type:complete len:60 (-) comp9217_c0_seq1:128-307(-)
MWLFLQCASEGEHNNLDCRLSFSFATLLLSARSRAKPCLSSATLNPQPLLGCQNKYSTD